MHNPYAAPQSKLDQDIDSKALPFEMIGKYLVVPQQIDMPTPCIKCGQAGLEKQQKTLTWANPLWILSIFVITIVGFIIIYLIVNKKLKISYYLCEEHLAKRTRKRWWLVISLLLIIGLGVGGALLVPVIGEDAGVNIGIASLVLVGIWAIVALVLRGDVSVAKVKRDENKKYRFYLKGVGEGFLRAVRLI